MEPIDYLRIARRRSAVILTCLVLGLLAGVSLALTAPRAKAAGAAYQGKATLALKPGSSPPVSLDAMAYYATVGQVPKLAAQQLHYGGDPAALTSRVTAQANDTLGIIVLTADGPTPPQASNVANVFAHNLIAWFDQQAQAEQSQSQSAAQSQVNHLQQQLTKLNQQVATSGGSNSIVQAELDAVSGQYSSAYGHLQQLASSPPANSGLSILQAATVATVVPVVPSKTTLGPAARGVVATVLGLLVGLALALVLEKLDRRIRTRPAAEEAFGLPVLTEVPQGGGRGAGPAVAFRPGSIAAEAYRGLRTALLQPGWERLGWWDGEADSELNGSQAAPIAPDGNGWASPVAPDGNGQGDGDSGGEELHPKVILVTSAGSAEGKSTVVANLAASFAEAGRSVLVISADMRRPMVHRDLGAVNEAGLSDVLAPRGTLPLARVVRDTSVPGVTLVTSGHPEEAPGRLLIRAPEVINEARQLADVVLVDSAPVLAANDASYLLSAADAVVLVGRYRRTTIDSAARARQLLHRLAAPTVGVVLVGARPEREAKRYEDSRRRRAPATPISVPAGRAHLLSITHAGGLSRFPGPDESRAPSSTAAPDNHSDFDDWERVHRPTRSASPTDGLLRRLRGNRRGR